MIQTVVPSSSQSEAIALDQGCFLVQAPPGSGKTEVLTRRTIRLLEKDTSSTFRILALSFTTKAAEELRKRVQSANFEQARRVKATTFHSFCLGALQHYGQFIGFESDTTVYENEVDRLAVLSKGLQVNQIPVPDQKQLRKWLWEISKKKRELLEPEDLFETHPRIARNYADYDLILQRSSTCDFDDLLRYAWRLFSQHPKVARHYRKLYRYIMVDEAQDTSRAQYEILRTICGDDHRNVMLVADSDQFINGFAGASDKWLGQFEREFGAQRMVLAENFRCAEQVISAANRLMGKNPETSIPVNASPGSVKAISYRDQEMEAEGVVSWVINLLKEGMPRDALLEDEVSTVRPCEICVLARNRFILAPIAERLEEKGIDVLFRSGRQLFETNEAKLIVQGFKILQNPKDAITREAILSAWEPSQREQGENILEVAPNVFFGRIAVANPGVSDLLDILMQTEGQASLGDLTRRLIEGLQSIAQGADNSNEEGRTEMLLADSKTLEERWRQYVASTPPESWTRGGFLGGITLGGSSVIEGPGVRLLTIHVAKGLGFKAVALAGLSHGVLPDYRRKTEEEIQDERRLTYVAMTRAKRILLLTRPERRTMPWGNIRRQIESRFVGEMGLTMESDSSAKP